MGAAALPDPIGGETNIWKEKGSHQVAGQTGGRAEMRGRVSPLLGLPAVPAWVPSQTIVTQAPCRNKGSPGSAEPPFGPCCVDR